MGVTQKLQQGGTNASNDPTGFFYFDSNVISYICHGLVANFIPKIVEHGGMPVVSEVVLQELRSGSPRGELDFIQNQGFMFASAHEALFLDGRRTFYTEPVEVDDETNSDFIENFLHQFVRSVSGSSSVPDLAKLLLRSAETVFNELTSELDVNTDPRILASWEAANVKFSNGMKDLRSLPSPDTINAELSAVRDLAILIGDLKPPGILNQIIQLSVFNDVQFLRDLTKPFAEDENMKERIQTLCLTLESGPINMLD